jgi:hypothetical protein
MRSTSNIGGSVNTGGSGNLLSYFSCVDGGNGQNNRTGTMNTPAVMPDITATNSHYSAGSNLTITSLGSPFFDDRRVAGHAFWRCRIQLIRDHGPGRRARASLADLAGLGSHRVGLARSLSQQASIKYGRGFKYEEAPETSPMGSVRARNSERARRVLKTPVLLERTGGPDPRRCKQCRRGMPEPSRRVWRPAGRYHRPL